MTNGSKDLCRIYFDSNEGDENGRFDLGIAGSLEDIAVLGARLKEGMRVVIYMSGELEMEAILEWDSRSNCWMGRPIEGSLKIYPEAYGEGSV